MCIQVYTTWYIEFEANFTNSYLTGFFTEMSDNYIDTMFRPDSHHSILFVKSTDNLWVQSRTKVQEEMLPVTLKHVFYLHML